jgi:hypothetical protein
MMMEAICSSETRFLQELQSVTSQFVCLHNVLQLLVAANVVPSSLVLSALAMETIQNKKQTPWPLDGERTIPTEQPPLVDAI